MRTVPLIYGQGQDVSPCTERRGTPRPYFLMNFFVATALSSATRTKYMPEA